MSTPKIVVAATGEEIDKAFDRGEDMRKYFDFSKGEVIMPEPGPHTVYYIQPDGSRRLATEEELNADHATILARLHDQGTVIPFSTSTHPSDDPDDEEPDLAMA